MNYQRKLEGKKPEVARSDRDYGDLVIECKDSTISTILMGLGLIGFGVFLGYGAYMAGGEDIHIAFIILIAVTSILFVIGGAALLYWMSDHIDFYNYGIKVCGKKGAEFQFSYDEIKEIKYEQKTLIHRNYVERTYFFRVMGYESEKPLYVFTKQSAAGSLQAIEYVGGYFQVFASDDAKNDENAVM